MRGERGERGERAGEGEVEGVCTCTYLTDFEEGLFRTEAATLLATSVANLGNKWIDQFEMG